MAEKTLNTRIQQKHDIELNWNKAINFIPKIGEIIVYDIDENYTYERFKIGDGTKTIIELPFAGITGLEISDNIVDLEGVNIIQNAHTLGGIAADQYALKSDLENLPDSNIGTITNINGIEPDENGTVILHANDVKAVTINLEETNEGEPALTNADTLGGISATEYALKSDLENIDLTNIDAVSLGGRAASEYALKFENWSDEEKTALVEYVFSALTNANGVIF